VDTIAVIDGKEVQMLQYWPVRLPRPVREKYQPDIPLITGQRVLDTMFPLAKGGAAAIPGAFGTGKTVTQQQLAKHSDAEIVVYIGCGERGNEMTEVLTEFPELEDPKTGEPLMKRTVLIANTSNMPVAAREASVYTGMTIAEYYRDMGYNVSLMADSTSRWAEAMREISSRLEEMPGEEGYPAYLAGRLSEFYERACRAMTLGGDDGSISVIGAVSPPGGDLSEPVTQNTLRIVRVFWALDTKLRERRHFPTINWLTSYSMYDKQLRSWYASNVASDFPALKEWAMLTLQKESELQEIVQMVGSDALPDEQKISLEVSKMIREIFLQQNAYHPVDTYCPIERQYVMLKLIKKYSDLAIKALEVGVQVNKVAYIPARQRFQQAKYEETVDEELKAVEADMDKQFAELGV
jgi:V/A-type H+-transporting ATPase subunit A